MLLKIIGINKIFRVLNRPELRPYLDAILTKKIAQCALYKYAADWEMFNIELKQYPIETIKMLFPD